MSDASLHPSALDALPSPIIILLGHFGAGKSEIAINLAFGCKQRGQDVVLVDLDLVKPYFRSRLAREELSAAGIRLIVPEGDRFYADLPILVPEVRGTLSPAGHGAAKVIIDVGGDDLGARVLGSLAPYVDTKTADILFVINGNRPFAEDIDAICTMLTQVEKAARLPISGLVANTHLMEETTSATVDAGMKLAQSVAERTGIPLRFQAVLKRLLNGGGALRFDHRCPILALDRRILPPEAQFWLPLRRREVVV